MAQSEENLKAAFAGESQANQRYGGFAKKAEEEGRPVIAKLFRAAAAAETVHAQNHLGVLGSVGGTADNLKAAMAGEAEEFRSMYPEFVEAARQEGNDEAVESFEVAMQVEKIHHELYGKALKAAEQGKDLPYRNIYVCRGCGNTVEDEVSDECPICGSPKSWFMWIQ